MPKDTQYGRTLFIDDVTYETTYNEIQSATPRQHHPHPAGGRRRDPRVHEGQAHCRYAAPGGAPDEGEEEAVEEGEVKLPFESDPAGGNRYISPNVPIWIGIGLFLVCTYGVLDAWFFPEHPYDRPLQTILLSPGIIAGPWMAIQAYLKNRKSKK